MFTFRPFPSCETLIFHGRIPCGTALANLLHGFGKRVVEMAARLPPPHDDERCVMSRTMLVLLLTTTLWSCSPTLRQTRGLLSDGDVREAALAAGEDRLALREVSLVILSRGLAEPHTRHAAMRGLVVAGDEARSTLAALVESSDLHISTFAAALLFRQGRETERIASLLRDALEAEDTDLRIAAIGALGNAAEEEAFFSPLLEDPDPRVRRAAIQALGSRSDFDPSARLLSPLAAGDPDPATRARALRALSRLDVDMEAVLPLVVAALESDSLALRLAAVAALSRRADEAAPRAALRSAMASLEGPAAVRAALALARNGDEEALQRLEGILLGSEIPLASTVAIGAAGVGDDVNDLLSRALQHEEPEVRLHVASHLLSSTERARALTELHALSELPGWVGVQASITLASEGDEAAITRLASSLDEEAPELRAHVAASAGLMPGGLVLLRPRLADEDESVRVAAAVGVLRLLAREG